jgi:hypothetical protein
MMEPQHSFTSRTKFSFAQRFALQRAYDMKCVYCGWPLDFKTLTIDYVMPESLVQSAEVLKAITTEYEILQSFPTFSIDDDSNWVPSHGANSNYQKAVTVFP